MTRPNVLYLHSHDTGRYVQPYGFPVPTPHLQALAQEGVLFRQAFCAAPTCSPSRAALLTGQVPHSCGQFGLVNRGFELRDRDKHLAHTLREAGYHTALVGVHHVVRDPRTCGYAQWVQTEDWASSTVADAAAAFLADPPAKPFFLAVGFADTHREFPKPENDQEALYGRPPLPLPDLPETRRDMAAFVASARRLDSAIGTVLAALQENDLARNTLVVCTTDHGIAFPLMKCHLTDHGIGVMLIVRGPGGFAGGQVIEAMVSHLDLYPTLCELLAIDRPSWLQGQSLLPLVTGQATEIHDQIAAEVNYHCPYEPMRAVRTRRWKYIRRYATYPYPMLANIDDSPSKDVLIQHGFDRRRVELEELYDLILDPTEACNLARDPASAAALADMRRRLDAWMETTGDPLLRGPIPLPEGALVSRPSDRSPKDIWNYTARQEGFS